MICKDQKDKNYLTLDPPGTFFVSVTFGNKCGQFLCAFISTWIKFGPNRTPNLSRLELSLGLPEPHIFFSPWIKFISAWIKFGPNRTPNFSRLELSLGLKKPRFISALIKFGSNRTPNFSLLAVKMLNLFSK